MINKTSDFDVAVIGGGIHGVGVAQAAAAAGYSVVLLEQTHLAYGTSRYSSKLIHGGLRYLENFEFGLVRESLHERELLIKLAPDLVKRQHFYLPIYEHTSRQPWMIRLGLTAYWALAGGNKATRFQQIKPADWGDLDGLSTDKLKRVFRYTDAQTDDALLTKAVMNSAQELGATLLCPAKVTQININKDNTLIHYSDRHCEQSLRAKTVVNATGPWASELLKQCHPDVTEFATDLIQGTHIELPDSVNQGCYYLEVPEDKRAVFVLPWKNRTLLGTTEQAYHADPHQVHSIDKSVDYLLRVYRHYFPNNNHQVLKRWAGLRVLPKTQENAFKRSRETQLITNNEHQPRLLSIFGGKLTSYRSTALKVMDILTRTLEKQKPIAKTDELILTCPEDTKIVRDN